MRKSSSRLAAVLVFGLSGAGRTASGTEEPGPPGRLALAVARTLSKGIGPRPTGSRFAARARDALSQALARAGLQPRRHAISHVVHPGVTAFGHSFFSKSEALFLDRSGENVYAMVPGRRPEAIVVSAHVDTEAPDVPGARDDAIGDGVVVELAARAATRARRDGPPERTLVFAFFDGEERGHLGSRAFARDGVAGPSVALALSLDNLGSSHPALNGLGPTVDRAVISRALESAWGAGVPLAVPLPHLFISRAVPQGERSDHRAFAEGGVDAFQLMSRGEEGFDPAYHTPLDVYDRIEPSAASDTVRWLDALLASVDGALDHPAGDHAFLPMAAWDPLGFSERARARLLPGTLARGLAGSAGAAAVLFLGLLIARARRRRGFRRSEAGQAFAFAGASAALGLAGGLPFLIGQAATGRRAPWHAPFEAYVLAGAASLAAAAAVLLGRPPMARAARSPWAAAAGLGAGLLIGAAFAGLGVPELALFPLSMAAALGAAALVDAPLPRALLGLGALPGLGLLARPALYRDGTLTGTLPEAGVSYLLVLAIAGLALAPGASFIASSALDALRLDLVRSRRVAGALVLGLTAAAAALTVRAIRQPAYGPGQPAVLSLVDAVDAQTRAEELILRGVPGPAGLTMSADGRTLAFSAAPGRWSVSLPEARVPFRVRAEVLPGAAAGRRKTRVEIRPLAGAPPIDRVEIRYTSGRSARLSLSGGASVGLSPGEELNVQIFGAGSGAVIDERTMECEGDCAPLRVAVDVRLAAAPGVELRLPPDTTVRRERVVRAAFELPRS